MNRDRIVAVAGGGAWGTALAMMAAGSAREVLLWQRDAEAARQIEASRVNARYLPGVTLPGNVRVTHEGAALAAADIVLLVVPAQAIRETLSALGSFLRPEAPLVICAKGIERATGLFLSDLVAELRPGAPVAALSGPSFAADVARGLPTALSLASPDGVLAADLAKALSGPALRIYHGTDLRGVEIGGATKNVLAIACGIVTGRRLGESASAALMARGFAEIRRFALAHGARPETLMGLSGLGDVALCCAPGGSRNFAFGVRLGDGASVQEASGGKLAEGAFTAAILVDLARRAGVDMPVAAAVASVLEGGAGIDQAIEVLLSRPLKSEEEV